jgi:hypothetical protein
MDPEHARGPVQRTSHDDALRQSMLPHACATVHSTIHAPLPHVTSPLQLAMPEQTTWQAVAALH